MYDYQSFANVIGHSIKSTYGPFFGDNKAQRQQFEDLIDAKVKLNKEIFSSTQDFVTSVGKVWPTS